MLMSKLYIPNYVGFPTRGKNTLDLVHFNNYTTKSPLYFNRTIKTLSTSLCKWLLDLLSLLTPVCTPIHTQHPLLTINGSTVAPNFWVSTSQMIPPGPLCLYFLYKLRKATAPVSIMATFYRGIESVLTSCITVWFESCTASENPAVDS